MFLLQHRSCVKTACNELSVVHKSVLVGVELGHYLLEVDFFKLVAIKGLEPSDEFIIAHASISILIELDERLSKLKSYIFQISDICFVNPACDEGESSLPQSLRFNKVLEEFADIVALNIILG